MVAIIKKQRHPLFRPRHLTVTVKYQHVIFNNLSFLSLFEQEIYPGVVLTPLLNTGAWS